MAEPTVSIVIVSWREQTTAAAHPTNKGREG